MVFPLVRFLLVDEVRMTSWYLLNPTWDVRASVVSI